MKLTSDAIASRGMAWTVGELNQWTKDNLDGTTVSIMWPPESTRCAESLMFYPSCCTEAFVVLTEACCKDSGNYVYHLVQRCIRL